MDRRKSKPRTPATTSPTAPVKTDPTPADLDRFIPWMFLKLQSAQTVVVKRLCQKEYPRGRNTRFLSSSRVSRVSTSVSIRQTESYPTLTTVPTTTSLNDEENSLRLTIFYSRAGHAVEIAISGCPFPINRKLIEVISLAIPYHTRLNRFTCKGKGLDYIVIDEVAKMLPLSNLTDICLDNTFVPQGNYYVLLDSPTLKCLSLSKCQIGDIVCKKIAERLEYNGSASKSLRMLSLSCNLITDIGAQALGHSLRTNRYIINLNLCGNNITSVGAGYILEPLSEFLLTTDEIKEKIRRRRDFYDRRAATPNSPTSTITSLSTDEGGYQKDGQSLPKNSYIDSKINVNTTDLDEKEVLEDFSDPCNTVFKNGRLFSIGNLTLCSLNLGYNYLDYTVLLKIVEVLMYQNNRDRAPRHTGLLRIVIEGNQLPIDCEEYSKIAMCLTILNNRALSFKKKRKSSSKIRRASSVVLIN